MLVEAIERPKGIPRKGAESLQGIALRLRDGYPFTPAIEQLVLAEVTLSPKADVTWAKNIAGLCERLREQTEDAVLEPSKLARSAVRMIEAFYAEHAQLAVITLRIDEAQWPFYAVGSRRFEVAGKGSLEFVKGRALELR